MQVEKDPKVRLNGEHKPGHHQKYILKYCGRNQSVHQHCCTITMTVVKAQISKRIDRTAVSAGSTLSAPTVSGLNISSGGESNLFAINNAL